MKCSIVETDWCPLPIVRLDEAMGVRLRRTADIALRFIAEQNAGLWAKASHQNFLNLLRRGAERLLAYGRAPDTRLVLDASLLGDSLCAVNAAAEMLDLSAADKANFRIRAC